MTQVNENKSGVLNALAAYGMWGLAPLYFKLLEHVSAPEILVHRIIWSFALLVIIVLAMGNWRKVQRILVNPKMLAWLLLTSVILGANWLIFIWAINNNYLLEASLGYFINPLFSVALGMLFLGERLRKWQKIAVIFALCGVIIQLISIGSIPVIALGLAGTFGIYGLFRKKLMVESVPGLLIESALMLPLGIAYWLFYMDTPTSNMMLNDSQLNITLIAAGLVTTAPLICFTAAAKRLSLATLGFFQYLGPTLMFILAIVLYKEQLIFEKLLTFVFIWIAIAIYSWDSIRKLKAAKRAKV
ncbi:EamA family transporter RarD [Thalassotalea psychrophila]|uniref:EamA family transporter RarD n=1 Tax=Thalassotalea psychrophila TaxID=3065647 RepID=A0ABY9TT60_9GAMM|nr:EamA family transporter RarD [Colwelliaceae bacterium SQ149]